jgi:diacylglycerol kinase (ATP)
MRARHSDMLHASQRAQHDDEAHGAGDDPFADIHDRAAPHARTDEVDGAHAAEHADHAKRMDREDRSAHAARGEPPLNGTAARALDETSGVATDAASMRYAGHPTTSRTPAMRSPLSTRHDPADAHEPLGPDDPLAPLPFNPYKGNRGITRAWHAMKNSFAGFRVAIREESAFRQELTLAAILVPCGLVVPVEPVSRVLLLGSVLLVLIVELLNSSVEAAIDRISLERHELSRRAKDLGSAAVMVALFMCVMTWAFIVGPLVVRWIGMLLH